MADPNVWSPTDDSNNEAPPNGAPEGMMPSGVNNTMRAMMGGTRRWYERINPALEAGGTENAIILAYPVGTDAKNGDVFTFFPTFTNTGPTTLDIGTGARPIIYGNVNPLRGGELRQTVPASVVWWDDGNFYLFPPAGGPTVAPLPLTTSMGYPEAQWINYTTGAPIELVVGDRFTFYPSVATNVGPVTLDVQGLGAHQVVAAGAALQGGELRQYAIVDVVWSGTDFHLLDPAVTPGNVRKTGDVMTGSLSAPSYNLDSVLFATHSGNATQISNGDGTGAAYYYGATGGYTNYQDGDRHEIRTHAGGVIAVYLAGGLSVSGYISASGQVTGSTIASSSWINAASNINAASYNCGGITFVTQSGSVRQIFDTAGVNNLSFYTSGENYYDNTLHQFRPRGGGGSTYALFNASGTYNVSGSWLTVSDAQLKTNIAPYERGLDAVLRLQPVSYQYTKGGPFADDAGTTRYGLVAQDVEPVVPEMVGTTEINEQSIATLNPGQLVYILVNSCKELAARVEALETQISAAQ